MLENIRRECAVNMTASCRLLAILAKELNNFHGMLNDDAFLRCKLPFSQKVKVFFSLLSCALTKRFFSPKEWSPNLRESSIKLIDCLLRVKEQLQRHLAKMRCKLPHVESQLESVLNLQIMAPDKNLTVFHPHQNFFND